MAKLKTKKVAVKKSSKPKTQGVAKDKPSKPKSEKKPDFKPIVACNNLHVEQVYAGFEIEKRWVLLTVEQDYTPKSNGLPTYDEVLRTGTLIEQGYIKDIQKAKEVIDELGIELLNDFKPTTIRLRKYGEDYIFCLKDRKETKRREAEFKLDEETFNKYWPLTVGARVYKKRLVKKVKNNTIELDAFMDRLLLLAEIEVTSEDQMDALPKLGMDVTGNSSWTNKSLSR